MLKLLTKIFGSRNDRVLRRFNKIVEQINRLEPEMVRLSDQQLQNKSIFFRTSLDQGNTLDKILCEAFAVVREASKRVFGLRPFDVQLIGAIVLHEGCIAEMRTGEGKTLTATMPAYLNALTGHGVHIVTVNDYLAKRDAENNRFLFEFLGLSVGVNLSSLSPEEKRQAYAADITYGTNNEFGFDYLRDNMVFNSEHRVQRALHYALIDEVDSILIDEARTPLIISGSTEDTSEIYQIIDQLIPQLQAQEREDSDEYQGEGHYYLDEKTRQAHLTERGQILVEELLTSKQLIQNGQSLYAPTNVSLLHHINVALRAHKLFTRNVDYIVKDGEIIIVDEHTGRTMLGRRWSDGLHQAIESKEGVKIQNENQTLASITLQNYFRLYEKLSGMTGTADTEAFEFHKIYNLDTVVIPTNKPMIRQDHSDLVYLTEEEKLNAIIDEIKTCVQQGRPTLVGTISIEKSEHLAQLLRKAGIKHQVLNAKFHAQEAEIIAQAGQPGNVTIATNMAGRGTDIVLGGNLQIEISTLSNAKPEIIAKVKDQWQKRHDNVVKAGGLHIIGTERHESRRIDNQLRGRSGRQGDPGSSRFYLSMEDSLMRIFASERVTKMMQRFGMQVGEAIEHPWVTRAIANAQRKVENYHFDIRKQLLEFDDVANEQRKAIYIQRNTLLDATDIKIILVDFRQAVAEELISLYVPLQLLEEQWDLDGLTTRLQTDFNLSIQLKEWIATQKNLTHEQLCTYVAQQFEDRYDLQEKIVGKDTLHHLAKGITLQTLDDLWKEHLTALDYLRQGIHLRGYAQKDPKQEYKKESFEMFSQLLSSFRYEVVCALCKIERRLPDEISVLDSQHRQAVEYAIRKQAIHNHPLDLNISSDPSSISSMESYKVGRNDLCPCGSSKKYKRCHGQL